MPLGDLAALPLAALAVIALAGALAVVVIALAVRRAAVALYQARRRGDPAVTMARAGRDLDPRLGLIVRRVDALRHDQLAPAELIALVSETLDEVAVASEAAKALGVRPGGDVAGEEGVPPAGDVLSPEGDVVPPAGDVAPPGGDVVLPAPDVVPPDGDVLPPGGSVARDGYAMELLRASRALESILDACLALEGTTDSNRRARAAIVLKWGHLNLMHARTSLAEEVEHLEEGIGARKPGWRTSRI